VTRRRKLLLLTGILGLTLASSIQVDTRPYLDPYQDYVANALSWRIQRDPDVWETTCDAGDRVEQVGVVAFRTMTLDTLGGGPGSIFACSRFEHEEGRAWDWMNDVNNPGDAARVRAMLLWLLSPDEYGRENAMARRLGLAYIIWNRRIITFWGSDRTWRPYYCDDNPTPSNCHTNHVHFAFSWGGARGETSWFATTPSPPRWLPQVVSTVDRLLAEAPS
jgi:hypothetical protein